MCLQNFHELILSALLSLFSAMISRLLSNLLTGFNSFLNISLAVSESLSKRGFKGLSRRGSNMRLGYDVFRKIGRAGR